MLPQAAISFCTATFQILTWNLGFTKIQLFHWVLDSDIFWEGWLFLFLSPLPCPEVPVTQRNPLPQSRAVLKAPLGRSCQGARSLWREMSFLEFFLIEQKPGPLLSWAKWTVQVLWGHVTVQEACCSHRDRRCPLTSWWLHAISVTCCARPRWSIFSSSFTEI